MPRACPQCGEELSSERRETAGATVTVDVCPGGDGVFLDEGETEQLTLGLELHPLLLDELAEDVGAPREECPDCNEIMVSEHLELAAEDIELDVCTVCHGIWLREDELSAMESMQAGGPRMGEAEIDEIWDDELPELRRRERIVELLGSIGQQEPPERPP